MSLFFEQKSPINVDLSSTFVRAANLSTLEGLQDNRTAGEFGCCCEIAPFVDKQLFSPSLTEAVGTGALSFQKWCRFFELNNSSWECRVRFVCLYLRSVSPLLSRMGCKCTRAIQVNNGDDHRGADVVGSPSTAEALSQPGSISGEITMNTQQHRSASSHVSKVRVRPYHLVSTRSPTRSRHREGTVSPSGDVSDIPTRRSRFGSSPSDNLSTRDTSPPEGSFFFVNFISVFQHPPHWMVPFSAIPLLGLVTTALTLNVMIPNAHVLPNSSPSTQFLLTIKVLINIATKLWVLLRWGL